MKTLKIAILIASVTLLTCGNISGQVIHQDVVVTISGIDYGPGIGTVYGTYTYRYTFKLSKDGFLENIHWNVINQNLANDNGDKIIVMDSGHDNLGIFWQIWNNINAWNEGYNISYAVEDGWLDDYIPPVMPVEGSYINPCKIKCKGVTLDFSIKVQIHINSSGEITANVIN
jgi:hypothetical protein